MEQFYANSWDFSLDPAHQIWLNSLLSDWIIESKQFVVICIKGVGGNSTQGVFHFSMVKILRGHVEEKRIKTEYPRHFSWDHLTRMEGCIHVGYGFKKKRPSKFCHDIPLSFSNLYSQLQHFLSCYVKVWTLILIVRKRHQLWYNTVINSLVVHNDIYFENYELLHF